MSYVNKRINFVMYNYVVGVSLMKCSVRACRFEGGGLSGEMH